MEILLMTVDAALLVAELCVLFTVADVTVGNKV